MKCDEIKFLMKDFKEIQNCSFKNKIILSFNEIPLEPHLMGYLFKNILGFNVKFQVFEKINYYIFFQYKKYRGCINHRKLYYELIISVKIKDEILDLLRKAKALLEEYFLELSANAIINNKYAIENKIYDYNNRLVFFENEIKRNQKIIRQMQKGERKSTNIITKKTQYGTCTTFKDLSIKYVKAVQYLTDSYIDAFYSYLEHILTLTSAFCNYKKNFENFEKLVGSGWKTKWFLVFADSKKSNELFGNIENIKELYRNRVAHGMFSKELKIYVSIDNFGNYPIFIGNKRRGFLENNSDMSSADIFSVVKNLKEEFINLLKEKYPCEMIIIQSGLNINLDKEVYAKALTSIDHARDYIEYVEELQNNQRNMDW